MSGGIEAAGDIATGALIGRAVEPHTGAGHAGGARHGLCLNCGTALIGEYCHACGQAEHVHRSLASIGHDLLHGVFHFEGKVWRTLPMLAFHPGALTRRYVAGERARFVSPLALFLFSVFLMFASIHTFDGDLQTSDITPVQRQEQLDRIDAQLAEARLELKAAQASPGPAGAPDGRLIGAQAVEKSLTAARATLLAEGGMMPTTFDSKIGWPALEKGLNKVKHNPGLALYKLQTSAYKYSWGLIPISVPFVALLFLWRRRFKLYDHAIFVTYSLAFMMLLVVVLSWGSWLGLSSDVIAPVAMIAPPVHMFAQLRGAYSLRKRAALWRTIVLMIFAFLALVAFSMLLLVLGLMK